MSSITGSLGNALLRHMQVRSLILAADPEHRPGRCRPQLAEAGKRDHAGRWVAMVFSQPGGSVGI